VPRSIRAGAQRAHLSIAAQQETGCLSASPETLDEREVDAIMGSCPDTASVVRGIPNGSNDPLITVIGGRVGSSVL